MADDIKRDETICFKGTEQMLIDINRLAALEDRKISDFLCGIIRRHLYGSMVRWEAAQSQSTRSDKVDG